MCYDGAFKEPKQVSFADSEATEPVPVSYYVCSQESDVTQHESSDIAEEVHKSLLVEERSFSACYQQPQIWKQRKEFKEKKVEDCAWAPLVDETLLKFWNLLNTNLASIFLKMVVLKLHIVQNHSELQISIMTERSST